MKPTIELDRQKGVLSIQIPGDLTSTSVREFQKEILASVLMPAGVAPPWQVVAFDLSAAQMVDSMGLNLIVKIFKIVRAAGGRMQVVYHDTNVHRTLLFTRLDHHVELVKG